MIQLVAYRHGVVVEPLIVGSWPSTHSAVCTSLMNCFFAVVLYVLKKSRVQASERSVIGTRCRFVCLCDKVVYSVGPLAIVR